MRMPVAVAVAMSVAVPMLVPMLVPVHVRMRACILNAVAEELPRFRPGRCLPQAMPIILVTPIFFFKPRRLRAGWRMQGGCGVRGVGGGVCGVWCGVR